MEILGRVRNVVVVLDGNPNLPEGARVTVIYSAQLLKKPSAERQRVQFPLVRSDEPGSANLTSERIGDILDDAR